MHHKRNCPAFTGVNRRVVSDPAAEYNHASNIMFLDYVEQRGGTGLKYRQIGIAIGVKPNKMRKDFFINAGLESTG